MEPDEMMPPPHDAAQMYEPVEPAEEYRKALVRQQRVIEMLREQIGAIVVANVEGAARSEELTDTITALRIENAELKGEDKATS